ncbi:hypothetical protein CC86DRAFT_448075 [Ophiobolus disseminans]|uniref:Uncharacterized protein n=1 Tax=Ophiobolus disseminans TaxID=1469910 RepID=A0A6A6ZQC9_9PLEO|nr:hypothetical protein CC86DRAFT_448075 [Ophiobolus disseminans]
MSQTNEQGSMDVKTKNVFNAPLYKHSTSSSAPKSLPKSLVAGFCTSSNPIAAQLTNAFLDYSTSNGIDLRKAGVGPGQHFCLEASAWKGLADKGGDDVPRVKLESTHEAALESVDLKLLKRFAADQDNQSVHGAVRPKDGKGSWVRESKEIGGKEPRA